MTETTLIALLLAGGLLAPAPAHADVNVGINIAPPPAFVVASPPLSVTARSPRGDGVTRVSRLIDTLTRPRVSPSSPRA